MTEFKNDEKEMSEEPVSTKLIETTALIQQLSEAFRPIGEAIANTIQAFQAGINNFLNENPNFTENIKFFIEEFQNLPQRQKEYWTCAATAGWFINSHTSVSVSRAIIDGKQSLDDFMTEHLERDWSEIKSVITEASPERAHILQCAFKLHNEQNYIASIPLFLSQADGICAQHLGTYLFTEKDKRKDKIAERINDKESRDLEAVLLSILTTDTQFNAGISSSSINKKSLAPNRNGILHGSRKHLDYGTKVNSLKAFSLLAFVSFLLAEKPERGQHLTREKNKERGSNKGEAPA